MLSHWFDANNIILFEESIVIMNKIRLVGVALDVLLTLIGSIPIMKLSKENIVIIAIKCTRLTYF